MNAPQLEFAEEARINNYEGEVIGINQCLCLPKAELNTKNSIRWQLCCHLVEFLVFNSITHVG